MKFWFHGVIFDGFVAVIEDLQSHSVQMELKIIFIDRVDLLDVFIESLRVFSYGQIK